MRPRSRTLRVQLGAPRFVPVGRMQRPPTRRPGTSRLTRNVTVADLDRVSETRVPTAADSAAPLRAARNRAGESRRREMTGATRSSPPMEPVVLPPASAPTRLKAASTERLWSIVTVHWPAPEQGPLQPAKLEPGAGAGVSVTEVPLGYVCEQSLPQSIPAGLLLTVPAPEPVLVTERVCATEGAAAVLTEKDRVAELEGLAAV